MSGVEIAGFVLASIPLMISALEHYRETAEVLEGWWQVKRQYTKCVRELNFHKIAFEENLESLLLPLIADEEMVKKLLLSPGGKEWQDPELELLLKARMPKSYKSYLETMEMIEETLEGLEEVLGMKKIHFQSRVTEEYKIVHQVPSGKRAVISHVASRGMESMEFHSQTIKWAFNKEARQELFEDFGKYNDRLKDILGASDRLAVLRSARASKSVAVNAGLWKFWSHGESLFRLLTEAWSCRCQASHQANLLLQHRSAPTANFRVVFWFKAHVGEAVVSQSPWTWQDTSIKLLEDCQIPSSGTSFPVPTLAPLTPPQPTQAPMIPKEMSLQPTKPQKAARRSFMEKLRNAKNSNSPTEDRPTKADLPSPREASTPVEPPPVTSGTSVPVRPKVSFSPPAVATHSSLTPKITNLCTTIARCSDYLSPYGCLQGDACQYVVQPLKAASHLHDYVTLETLLSTTPPIKLTRRQRFEIALILASTHIQLHPTPWLKSKWNKTDIFFPRDIHNPDKVCTDQPYISKSLSKSLASNANTSPVSSSVYTFQSSVRNLGIMLLELCFGSPIEEHRICRSMPASTDEMTQLVNYMAATEWLRDVIEEAGPEYSDAVNWCLHYMPESSGTNGQEDKWREAMFSKVVEPLKYCHDQLMAV